MQNKLVIQFKEQMMANIGECAFSSLSVWQDHIRYMLNNPDECWLNILSIFLCRKKPRKVMRFPLWQETLDTKPIIKKGLCGIPVVVSIDEKEISVSNSEKERIVYDAWDIYDLNGGENYVVSSPLLNVVQSAHDKYCLSHDTAFWEEFFQRLLTQNLFLSSLDQSLKSFVFQSLIYTVLHEYTIDFSIIERRKDDSFLLNNIYSNFYDVLKGAEAAYKEYAQAAGKDVQAQQKLKVALLRSQRKLPQRIKDAQLLIDENRKKNDTGYGSDIPFELEVERINYNE